MTISNEERQQKARRMLELFDIARQRYLEAGGDPLRSANEQNMTEEEKQEFIKVSSQVFDEEYIKKSLEKKRQEKANSQKVS